MRGQGRVDADLMGTIIDSLVLELGFDVSNLPKGRAVVTDTFKKTSDAAKKTGIDVEDSAKKAGEYITRLRNNVLGLFAAFTAGRGIKDFVRDMTNGNAELGRFAVRVNQSAETIAKWRATSKLLGGSAEDVDSAFQTLSSDFQNFSITGESSFVPWFRALGISLSDAKGEMKPINDILLELSQRMQGMNSARATTFLQNMGFTPGMINIILQGPAAIQKMLDSQAKLAKAQAADVAAAQRRQKAWADFINQAETIGNVLLTELTPALIAVTNVMRSFAEWGERHPEIVGAAFAALTGIVTALSAAMTATFASSAFSTVVGAFSSLIKMVSGLILRLGVLIVDTFPAIGEALAVFSEALLATPVGWIIAAIAAVSVAGYELYKHWDTIKRWWHSLWGDMGDDAQRGSDRAREAAAKLEQQRSGKGPAASGPQVDKDIDFFMRKGWSRNQAIGIVASIQEESGGKTNAVGDGGSAYGLAQWHYDRQQAFAGWAGHSLRSSTRAEQLAFIDYELRSREANAGKALSKTTSATQAADVVSRLYERPANVEGASARRQVLAAQLARATPSGIQANQQLALLASGGTSTVNNRSNATHIQEMNINTQATDANGIARDMHKALSMNDLVQQSNYGPA